MHVGIDAGGTSTRAVVVASDGTCRGYGIAGGGNPVSWGVDVAARQIRIAVTAALAGGPGGERLGPQGAAIGGIVVLAMAGGNSLPARSAIEAELAAAGVPATLSVESDLLATFCAGTHRTDGYALVAGTGAAAIRVTGGEAVASADGLGWLLGDGGSGFWIGHRGARAALAALDGRGPATTLTDLLLGELSIAPGGGPDADGRPAALQAAVTALYQWRPVELSRLAAVVFRAADAGDAVAMKILTRARAILAGTLAAVRRADPVGPIVMGGGIARRLPGLADAVARAGARHSDTASAVYTVGDGAVGAGVLALRRNGVRVDEPVFRRLVDTLAPLRAAQRA